MLKSYTAADLLALNRHIDEQEFRRIAKVLKMLKETRPGVGGPSQPPTSQRRRIVIGERDSTDSRTVHLGRHSRG
jgi:hypothetical protein